MAQVSLRGKKLLGKTLTLVTICLKNNSFSSLTNKRVLYISRWLLFGLGLVLMIAWNWKLVVATSSGITLMLLVYRMQEWNWSSYWLHWRQFVKGSSGKLTLAVGSGSFAALSTYVATSIWADSENRWLATGTILQGLATFLTLGLLVSNFFSQNQEKLETKFEQLVSDLTDSDSLKRLIAVRRLSSLKEKGHLSSLDQDFLHEYLSLMLTQETEKQVKNAILETLGQKSKIAANSQNLPVLLESPLQSLVKTTEKPNNLLSLKNQEKVI